MTGLEGFWLAANITETVSVDCYTCGGTVAEGDALNLGEVAVAASQHACPAREGE